MGNAIKYIRHVVTKISVDTSDDDAKRKLIAAIDKFIDTDIDGAQQHLARHGLTKMKNGDIVLVYAHSSVIKKVLYHSAVR